MSVVAKKISAFLLVLTLISGSVRGDELAEPPLPPAKVATKPKPAEKPAEMTPTDADATTRDMLVYKDGDRVHGKLIQKNADTIVFESERFGELRVPAAGAVVIMAERTPDPAKKLPELNVAVAKTAAPAPDKAAASTQPAKPAPTSDAQVAQAEKHATEQAVEKAEAEKVSRWERFSPAQLTARMREFFGPWRGKVAFSTEVVTDTAERANVSAELQLRRKWKHDEVQGTARYDFSQTNDITSTDTVKANALWRHEFKEKWFAQYRPTLEWNRAAFKSTVPADYLLLQQEIGLGYRLIVKPTRTVRVGLSENMFDTWGLVAPRSKTSRTVESAFLEAELKLPWRMTLTDRSIYYYSVSSTDTGWENNFELSKRFTETLSTSIRHELRQGSPDSRVVDYTRLKLMIGLDF